MSKELRILDLNLFSGSEETMRTALGGYWEVVSSSEGEVLERVYYYSDSEDGEIDTPYNPFLYSAEANADLRETLSDEVIIPNSRFPVRLNGDADTIKDDNHWKTILLGGTFQGINYNAIYTDSTFDNSSITYERPYTKQESNYIFGNFVTNIADVTYDYNHYLPQYQDYIKNLDSELLIPNMYLLNMFMVSEGETFDDFIENFVTLEGTYESAADLLVEQEEYVDTDGNFINMEDSLIYQYLSSSIVLTSLSASTTTHMKNRTKNIFFDENILSDSTYSAMGTYTGMVPYYIKFNFSASAGSTFVDYMTTYNYSQKFMKTLKEAFNGEISITPTDLEHAVETTYYSGSANLEQFSYIINTENESYRQIDFMDSLLYSYRNFISTTNDCYFLGIPDIDRKAVMDASGSYRYVNSLNSLKMINSTVDYLSNEDNFSIDSMSDLFSLEPKYKETLAYRIEKIGGAPTGDSQTQNVLQNFWFFNSADFMYNSNFYDSQIKYNTDYTYKVYAYVLTVGCKYNFSDLALTRQIGQGVAIANEDDPANTIYNSCLEFYNPLTDEVTEQLYSEETNLTDNVFATNAQIMSDGSTDLYKADFYVNYEPTLKIVEIPIFSRTLRAMDHLPNQVNVIPYQMLDMSQRIGFSLHYEVFNETAKYPSTISSEDVTIKANYLNANNLLSGSYVPAESVSKQRYVEVYRTEEKPTNITDFDNNMITRVDLKEPSSLDIFSVQEYIQKIKANQKYYYLFRAVNEQGITGQLSEIYEAQLINDGGYIYSIFNILFEGDLEEEIFVNPFKDFKKLIQIQPNLAQTTLVTDDVDFGEIASSQMGSMAVGNADELIWDRQFKIRLTSQKTGKQIDLNFTYKLVSD